MGLADEVKEAMGVESNKALGMIDLIDRGFPCPSSTFIVRDKEGVLRAKFLRSTVPMDSKKYFMRPCPKVPRHGVLESVFFVNDDKADETIHKFLDDMIKHGEENPVIVIQPFVQAKMSGIIDRGSITLGKDHDGVTAGKGFTVSFPLPEDIVPGWCGQIEFIVQDKDLVLFTQNRAVPAGTDGLKTALPKGARHGFANGKVDIDHFFVTKGLDNAEEVESMDLSGVAIIHIGGNSASHIAVHCRNYRGSVYLPVSTDAEAEVLGKEIEAVDRLWAVNVGRNAVMLTQEPDSVPSHLEPVLNVNRSELAGKVVAFSNPQYISTLLGAAPALKMVAHSDEIAYLQAIIVGVYLKASALACLGEARHFSGRVDVARQHGLRVYEWLGVPESSRENIYMNVQLTKGIWDNSPNEELRKLRTAIDLTHHIFTGYDWGGGVNSNAGYGGKRWGAISVAVLKGLDALIIDDFPTAMRVGNELERITHNGGRTGIEKFPMPMSREMLWGWGTEYIKRGGPSSSFVNYVKLTAMAAKLLPGFGDLNSTLLTKDTCLYKGLDTFNKTASAFRDHETWMYKTTSMSSKQKPYVAGNPPPAMNSINAVQPVDDIIEQFLKEIQNDGLVYAGFTVDSVQPKYGDE